MTTDQIPTEAEGLNLSDQRRRRLSINKDAILAAMKAAGIVSIIASYTGEGDEGSPTDLEAQPPDVDLSVELTMAMQTSGWDEAQRCWAWSDTETRMALDEAMSAFVDEVIQHHHAGFENGDGGGGEVTFDATDMTVTYDNFNYVVERDYAGEILL